MGNGAKHVEHKLLIVLHVGGVDFEQIVVLPRNVVTLCHLGNVGDGLGKVGRNVAPQTIHLDLAEYHKTAVELLGIEHGYVTLDYAVALHALYTLKHGGGAEVDTRCQLLDGKACIGL